MNQWRRVIKGVGAMAAMFAGLGLLAQETRTAPETFPLALADGSSVDVARFPPARDRVRQGTIMLWHGGGWTQGAPSLLFPHAAAFAAEGFDCLLPAYPLAGPERGIARCVADARAILRALVEQETALGVDTARLYLLGESSGGHLAAMLASDADRPPLAGLILWNPVLDLRTLAWLETRHGPLFDRAALSPITRLRAGHPPTLLLHGTEDAVVPAEQAKEWHAAALDAGIPHRQTLLPGRAHAFAFSTNKAPEPSALSGIETAIAHTLAFLRAPDSAVDQPGEFSIVHAFEPADGWQPFAELARSGDTAWGVAHAGGAANQGTLFRVDLRTRSFAVVHAMQPGEGREPFTGFAFGEDRFWGVTKFGGPDKGGTLFEFQPATGTYDVLAAFGANAQPPAWNPHAAPLLVDGALWGTTFHGGTSRWGGAVYRVAATGGPLEIMQSFTAETGEHPAGQLLLHGGWLYGTLSDYGKEASGAHGALFRLRPDGTDFEVIHRFAGGGLGAHPYDRLVPHPDGFLLGTTFGAFDDPTDRGTVFAWHLHTGRFETLVDFNRVPVAGGKPNGAIALNPNGEECWLTTHGSLDPEHGFTGTALRFEIGADRIEHGFARRLRIERIEVRHRFTGDTQGSTPMRTPLLHKGALWGVTAFGHDQPNSALADPTQSGGLVYRLALGPSENRGFDWVGRALLGMAIVVVCGVLWLVFRQTRE